MNYDQNAYKFAPTYRDESTAYHCHMISVVVFFYSNKLKVMLVDYLVTYMGCFDDYYDSARRAKTMSGNGITTFLFHFSQCITFLQNRFLQQLLLPRHL